MALRQILKTLGNISTAHSLENYRESNTSPNYELVNKKQHSLQISIWISQEPFNRYVSFTFDGWNIDRMLFWSIDWNNPQP